MTMPNVLYNGPGNWPDADKLMANYNYLENIAIAYTTFRNRIINGDMRIDQRNEGASVTVNSTTPVFCVDRWSGAGQATDGVFTLQRMTAAPTGFKNSLKATVTTADASIGSTQTYFIRHKIEGNNIVDFAMGISSGKSVTLSFWVNTSVTGTFTVAFLNSDESRAYLENYTVNAASTWEQKTITIPCDTTGTWLNDSGVGLSLIFSLGAGAASIGTPRTWGGYATATSGQVNLIATNGATFYLTGVQLELGTVATTFETRNIGHELNICQRYFEKSFPSGTVPGTVTNSGVVWGSRQNGGFDLWTQFRVIKNSSPTMVFYSPQTGTSAKVRNYATPGDETASNPIVCDSSVYVEGTTSTVGHRMGFHYTASAEL